MLTMNPPATTTARSLADRTLHLLYADDMLELRELMSEMLAHEGHYIETVASGSLALARLEESRNCFDVLITDHHMPGLNGLEVVRLARAQAFPGKIVVFSSELSEAVLEKYRAFNVDAILAKPIFPLTFRTVLEQLFAGAPPARSADPFPANRD